MKMVTEHQIPQTVEIDHKSQNRDTGTPQNVVSQMAHDLTQKVKSVGSRLRSAMIVSCYVGVTPVTAERRHYMLMRRTWTRSSALLRIVTQV